MNAFTIFKDAWQNRDQLGDGSKTRELAAFLPAALEIQEAPPNPIAKWLSRSLIVLVCAGFAWAWVGEVNIVASAEGKIIPSSRVKQIQPLEAAIVKRIFVTEGQSVDKGEPLIELDSTITQADEKRLQVELDSAQLNWAVSKALLKLLDTPVKKQRKIKLKAVALENVATLNKQDIELHKRLIWQQWQQYLTQRQSLLSAHAKTHAEQSATDETITKLEQIVPIITQRATTAKNLHNQGFLPETDYLLLEQERIQHTQDLAVEKQRLKQLYAIEQDILQQIKTLTAQAKTSQLTNIAEMQRQIAAIQEELSKAVDLNARRILYSPVSGQVQALAVNTVGGVVTDAQQLMLIVPDEEQLEVEVFLENKDIGFVEEGLPAEIKIHTFPFTKYGVIDAEITSISDDATVDEQRGLIYGMQLLLHKNTIDVDGRRVKLMPGMAVTAEVKTGKRRIAEFFLAPLLRHGQESLRER